MLIFVKFCNMNKYLITLWILCILGLIVFVGHYSGILIDFGREVYYPEQILAGKVLYKDLFNIYGPFAYQINAILYKIFGIKLSTLYGAGFVGSLFIVNGIFLIAKRFLSDFLSFCISFLTIFIGITTTSIFNFHFPYSWAVLYGLVAFIYSLLFLLKFEENKDSKYLCISTFLAGICVTCKYDFLLYSIVVIYFAIKNKNYKALAAFFTIPIISYGALFLQGMKISDLLNTINIINTMAHTKTLTYFYQNSGVYFHFSALPFNLVLFLLFALPFSLFLFCINAYTKSKVYSIIGVFSALFILFIINVFCEITIGGKFVFCFLPIFLAVFAIVSYKKIDAKLLILVISVLAVSVKIFWLALVGSYGTYYIPLLLIASIALLFRFIPQKFEKAVGIYFLVLCFLYFYPGGVFKSEKIKTSKGTISTYRYTAKGSNELIEYINQNTKPDDKVVIFPEGMMINFLTNRKSDDFYNSLLPLYIETFGEDKIVEHFKSDKPDYIIFNNLDMKDYYYRYICQDYALGFCEFVKENYKPETVMGNNFRYTIFKKL